MAFSKLLGQHMNVLNPYMPWVGAFNVSLACCLLGGGIVAAFFLFIIAMWCGNIIFGDDKPE